VRRAAAPPFGLRVPLGVLLPAADASLPRAGMLLEALNHGDLLALLASPAALAENVLEALEVLREHRLHAHDGDACVGKGGAGASQPTNDATDPPTPQKVTVLSSQETLQSSLTDRGNTSKGFRRTGDPLWLKRVAKSAEEVRAESDRVAKEAEVTLARLKAGKKLATARAASEKAATSAFKARNSWSTEKAKPGAASATMTAKELPTKVTVVETKERDAAVVAADCERQLRRVAAINQRATYDAALSEYIKAEAKRCRDGGPKKCREQKPRVEPNAPVATKGAAPSRANASTPNAFSLAVAAGKRRTVSNAWLVWNTAATATAGAVLSSTAATKPPGGDREKEGAYRLMSFILLLHHANVTPSQFILFLMSMFSTEPQYV
jgi:hypothetical protein